MIAKHSIAIRGHRTSFSLEDAFWRELKSIARQDKRSLSAVITEIDAGRSASENLSSAIRLFVLQRLKQQAAKRRDPASIAECVGPDARQAVKVRDR